MYIHMYIVCVYVMNFKNNKLSYSQNVFHENIYNVKYLFI